MTYNQWIDPTPCDEGVPDDDALLDMAIAAARTTPNESHDALLALIGLVQKIGGDAVKDQRYFEAREVAKAYL